MLDQLGVTWYVPHDFDERQFSIVNEPILSTLDKGNDKSDIEQNTDITKAVDIDGLNIELNEPKQSVDTLASTPALKKVVPEVVEEAKPEKSDHELATYINNESIEPSVVVEPFNWLIARCDFVTFVCDIKHPQLPNVWEAAALELLNDIAIAVGAKEPLNFEYFSWPIVNDMNVAVTDIDLPDFLVSYLESSSEAGLYLLLGDNASKHGCIFDEQAECVKSVSLGQLFKDIEYKKALWQQLKPIRRL